MSRIFGILITLLLALPFGGAHAQPAEQQLRVAVSEVPPSRGNPFGGRSLPSTLVWDAVFDPLVRIGATGSPEPALATSWELREPTVWRFKLRSGVTFQNGEPFNADAAVATFNWLTSTAGRASVVGAEMRDLQSATKIDDSTVDIKTARPNPLLPNQLSMVFMVEPKAWAAGIDSFAQAPVGTGPFQVESFAPSGVSMIAAKNAWRKAHVQKVRVVGLPERAARLQALLSGQVDVAFGLAPDQIAQIKSAGQMVVATPAPQVMSIAFITEGKDTPLKDPRVRLALNYAVNKQAIADVLLAGLGKPASQAGTPAAFGYDPDLEPIPYDPARAKALLAEAGYPQGFNMVVEVVVDSFPADSEIYQQAASDLGAVGVKTELHQIRFPEWLRKFLNGGWEGQAYGSSWNTAPQMDAARPFLIFSCLKKPTFFCDPNVVPLISGALQEFDPGKRKDFITKLNHETQKNPPALFLVEQVDVTGVSAKVEGFRYLNRTVYYDQVKFK